MIAFTQNISCAGTSGSLRRRAGGAPSVWDTVMKQCFFAHLLDRPVVLLQGQHEARSSNGAGSCSPATPLERPL